MRTSAPFACSARRLDVEPGTRVMSPKVVMMTPGMRASAITLSMSWLDVTQTGHPGPDASFTLSGMSDRIPLRAMDTVWVPHTSMRVTWRSVGANVRMDSTSPFAS